MGKVPIMREETGGNRAGKGSGGSWVRVAFLSVVVLLLGGMAFSRAPAAAWISFSGKKLPRNRQTRGLPWNK